MSAFEAFLKKQGWGRRTDAEWAEVLARMPLFAGLERRQLIKVGRKAEFADFAPGDVVLVAGSRADFFYVILDGEVEVRTEPKSQRLGRGDYFGEAALIDGAKRTASVVATERLRVMRLPAEVFLRLARKRPAVALAILRELNDRGRRRDRQLAEAA